jgi:hypothetical protein
MARMAARRLSLLAGHQPSTPRNKADSHGRFQLVYPVRDPELARASGENDDEEELE